MPSKLYWLLFSINNLREAVDTAKRLLDKEKLDKQLTGQASKHISIHENERSQAFRSTGVDETTRFRDSQLQ